MGVRGVFFACRKVVLGALAACLLASVLVVVGSSSAVSAQSASSSASAASSVEIAARKLSNGDVEFALRLAGGQYWLPNARIFVYADVDTGRWLQSSPFVMSDGREVRVRARKLSNGKVEFALQVGANRQWLPSSRMFPYRTASVGQWLYSSQYSVGTTTTPLETNTSSTSSNRSHQTSESTNQNKIGVWTVSNFESGAPFILTAAQSVGILLHLPWERPPGLFAACTSGQVAVGVIWAYYTPVFPRKDSSYNWRTREIEESDPYAEISFRFDQGDWTHENWIPNNDTIADGTYTPNPRSFLESARRADSVTVNHSWYEIVFELDGLEAALRTLTCY